VNPLAAQWVQSGPYGYGCHINAFAVSGHDVFAAGYNGIFVSTNDGTDWKGAVNGPYNACQALAVFSSATGGANLLAGCGLSILYSPDAGANWRVWDNGLEDRFVSSFVVSGDGKGGANVFAAVSSPGGVFLSTDGGRNWKEIDSDLTDMCHSVYALAVSGSNLFVGTDVGVFVLTNSGTTWTQVYSGPANRAVKALVVSDTDLFAGTASGVDRSTDNGKSWSEANAGMANAPVSALAILGNDLVVGTDSSGIFRSTDHGATWVAASTGLTDSTIHALAASGTRLFAGTNRGVFVSINGGTLWQESNTGITNGQVNALACIGTDLFAGTTSGVYCSAGESAGWDRLGLSGYVTTLAASGTDLLAGRANTDGAFRSTDDGTSWIEIDSGLLTPGAMTEILTFAFSDTNIFAGTYGQGIFLSTNEGNGWTPVNNGLSSIRAIRAIVVHGSDIFAGTGAGVFLSTNSGASWTSVGAESPPGVSALLFAGTDLFAGTYYGAFRLDDGGKDWIPVDSGLTGIGVQALSVFGRNVFAGTDSGVFVTTDRGIHWTAISSGMPARSVSGITANTSVLALLVSGSDLVAGTANLGVWKRPLSEITGVEKRTDKVPEGYSLRQNYPNPFNPSTVISYHLPIGIHVTLKVYDVLGRDVATLVNERQDAGDHSVTLNAVHLSSGVYLCRLQAGSYHDVKRLMLVK
jgi:photosystem II stability/assembly factor-like uncharacterized protein